MSTSHSQWSLTSGHVFGWAFVLCRGGSSACVPGEQERQDFRRAGPLIWSALAPDAGLGCWEAAVRAPCQQPGPSSRSPSWGWSCWYCCLPNWDLQNLGSAWQRWESGMFGQPWGFTQIARPSVEDTTCAKLTLVRKWKNKSGLIKLKKEKKNP